MLAINHSFSWGSAKLAWSAGCCPEVSSKFIRTDGLHISGYWALLKGDSSYHRFGATLVEERFLEKGPSEKLQHQWLKKGLTWTFGIPWPPNLLSLLPPFSLPWHPPPPGCQAHQKAYTVAACGFENASGQGFGCSVELSDVIHYAHGQWHSDISSANSSNFKDLYRTWQLKVFSVVRAFPFYW